jgi:hypothetical protein
MVDTGARAAPVDVLNCCAGWTRVWPRAYTPKTSIWRNSVNAAIFRKPGSRPRSTCLISLIKNGATRCQAIEINLSSGIDLGVLFEMNIQRDRTMFEGRAAEILKSIEIGCVKAPPHDDAITSAFHNARYVSHARQARQRLIQQEVLSIVRNVFTSAAEVIASIDVGPAPRDPRDLRSLAESIDPDQPLLRQREKVWIKALILTAWGTIVVGLMVSIAPRSVELNSSIRLGKEL